MGFPTENIMTNATLAVIDKVGHSKPVKFLGELGEKQYRREVNKYYSHIKKSLIQLQYPNKLFILRVGDLSDVKALYDEEAYYSFSDLRVRKKEYEVRNDEDVIVYRAELDSPHNKVTIVSSDGKKSAVIKRKQAHIVHNGDYVFSVMVSGNDIGEVCFVRSNRQFDYQYNDWHILIPQRHFRIASVAKKHDLNSIRVISDGMGDIGEIVVGTLGMSFSYSIPQIDFPMVVACFILELYSNHYNW